MDGLTLREISTSLLALAVAGYLAWTLGTKSRSRLPLPPGPKPFPIIGNMLDIPQKKEKETYDQWYHKYGASVVCIKLCHTGITKRFRRYRAHLIQWPAHCCSELGQGGNRPLRASLRYLLKPASDRHGERPVSPCAYLFYITQPHDIT